MSGFLTLNSFAAKLNVVRQTAQKKVEAGDYVAFKRGNQWFIPECAVEAKEVQAFFNTNLREKRKAQVLMIGNNKGGTGKTTTSVNLAGSLAFLGYKVLLVDNDIQSNASSIDGLDVRHDFTKRNLTSLLLSLDRMTDAEVKKELSEIIVNVRNEMLSSGELYLLPNSLEMDEQQEQLMFRPNAENLMDRLFAHLKADYDFVVVDSSPTLDVSWRMGVIASDALIISAKAEKFSIDGLGGVFRRIYNLNGSYRDRRHKDIAVLGATIVDYNPRLNSTKVNEPALEEAMTSLGRFNTPHMLTPFAPSTSKAANSQVLSGVFLFDEPTSQIAASYIELANNILLRYFELLFERGEL